MYPGIIDGFQVGNFQVGGIIAILAIVMVFVILLIITILAEIVSKIIYQFEKKYLPKDEQAAIQNVKNEAETLDLNDENKTIACLIASIECRNETHKNVKVISVKEVL